MKQDSQKSSSLFANLGLSSDFVQVLDRLNFKTPTPIQEKSIPETLQGKDVIGIAQTGTGKTLAFCLPMLEKIRKEGGSGLIVVPTRELAAQVSEEIEKVGGRLGFKTTLLVGGADIGQQIRSLRRGPHVIVATPGRLNDHLERRTADLSHVHTLVLDEADRMLDMGFIRDVEKIIQRCPRERQTLFFSATISSEIKSLANKYMKDPIKVSATKLVDPSKLKQVYYNAPKGLKLPLLVNLLRTEKTGLVMVFCNMRVTTDFVVKNLRLNKVDAMAIHGGLTQNKRSNMMSLFNDGKVSVLVCTDVAARGLHIENVSHVYNYEIPKDAKDYVHRIGRTARAGESGKVVNLLAENDYDNFSRVLREYDSFKIEKIDTPKLERIEISKRESFVRKPMHNGFRKGFNKNNFRRRNS